MGGMEATRGKEAICNIGPAERRVRRTSAIMSAGLTVGIWLAFVLLRLPWWLAFILVIPTFIAVLNFTQDRQKFCVSYGLGGFINMGEGLEKVDKVAAESLKLYRHKAWQLISSSIIVTALIDLVLIGVLFFL